MVVYKELVVMANKKGELGPVWIAAHFPNRLRKELVEQTSICSSVDKILVEQFPRVTYRTLGFLLLGIARLYSKKVEYLYLDCNNTLNEMKSHFGGSRQVNIDAVSESSSRKNCNPFVEAMRAQVSSISLPENFQLDAFDLGDMEDEGDEAHVKSNWEIVLSDARELGHHTFGKDLWDVSASLASTSAVHSNINASNSDMSAEILRVRFSLDECPDPMVFGDTDEEVDLATTLILEQDPEGKNTNSSDYYMIFEDREHPDTDDRRKRKCPVEEGTSGETMVAEMTLGDSMVLKPSPHRHQLSVSIDVTPQSKAPTVSGEHRSDRVALYTPASKEPVKAQRKHKCVYDDNNIVIPNHVFKGWLADASDLVSKRWKAPNPLIARKEFDCILEPIIPIKADFPSNLGSVISRIKLELLEKVEDLMEPDSKIDELGSPNLPETSEQEGAGTIAPLTPAGESTSWRFDEIHETNQVGPSNSSESIELDEIPMNEGPSLCGEDNQGHEKWSAVTKSIGSYLHSNLEQKRERGQEEALNLSSILKRKTKKESARFFAEILILKTGGFIDVKQEKAYDEIRAMQTSKLKDVFRTSS